MSTPWCKVLVMDVISRLAQAGTTLAESEQRTAARRLDRDRLIAEALAAGVTWAEIQRITGMNPNAIRKARDRARAAV